MKPWEDPRLRAGFTRQLEHYRHDIAQGATPIGWKVGFGAPAALASMQLTAPLPGYLTDRTHFGNGLTLDTTSWTKGLIEFEVAVYVGESLGSGTTPEQARASVASLGPAIEVADLDLTPSPDAVGDILAGDIFHRGVVLGEPSAQRAGIDLDGLEAVIGIDGHEVARVTELEALTGRYDEVVATVANTLGAFGETLEGGAVIITGSVIPPVPLADGSEFSFRLSGFEPLVLRRQ